MQPSTYLTLSDEVQTALQEQHPVVALESTVIAHGLPYPTNIEVAQSMESAIRAEGAIPATIGIHNGTIKIGLNLDEITHLGIAQNVRKVSRRDLAITLATKQLGATTVAGTMLCASMVGIRFFATGGIGGVHRGAETSMDISADLTELSRSPVLVVCAGAKSILDLNLTLPIIRTALDNLTAEIPDLIPQAVRLRLLLVSPREALWQVHWPEAGESFDDLQSSRTAAHIRLIFEELFFLELGRIG